MVLDFWNCFWNARWIKIFGIVLGMQGGSRFLAIVLECKMDQDFGSCFRMQDGSRLWGFLGMQDGSRFSGLFWNAGWINNFGFALRM